MPLSVILLPGLDGTGRLFASLLECLAPELHTVAVQYPVRATGYSELQAYVDSLAQEVGECVLLGESFSGPIAVAVAANQPNLVRGVILSTSFLRCPRAALKVLSPLLGAGLLPKPPAALASRILLGRARSDRLARELVAALALVPAETLTARLSSIAGIDVTEQAALLQVPSLYLRGTDDALIPAEAGEHFAASVAGAKIVDIAGPHALLQASPRECAEQIHALIRAVPSR